MISSRSLLTTNRYNESEKREKINPSFDSSPSSIRTSVTNVSKGSKVSVYS